MNINEKIKLLEFKLKKNIVWDLFWVYKSKFLGYWMEFAEHREYSFWDNVKHIDWKASAKSNEMLVKKYEEERDLNVLFLLDSSSSMEFGSEEKTKKDLQEEIFYSLALCAISNWDNIWALLYDEKSTDFINFKKSEENIFRVLEKLEKTKLRYDKSYLYGAKTEIALQKVEKLKLRNSLIFVLTDDTNFENENILRLVWIENDIIIINIFDYFENNLLEENANLSFNLWKNFLNIFSSKNLQKDFSKLRKEKLDLLEKKLNKNGIWYIMLDNKSDFFLEIIKYFSTSP